MGENSLYVKGEKIQEQVTQLGTLVSIDLAVDKINNLNSLLSNNAGETASTLLEVNSTLLEIEETMTALIEATATMLNYVDVAYETADTVDTSVQ
ncbi:MAG: hypothetical protein IJO70_06930 [Lachnospiraceae bacterium]|nr:hypothetical protein [Lachnospiraceae bacterium]